MTNYALASSTWNENEYAAIQRVIDSDMFTMGKEVAQYEKNFADFFGSNGEEPNTYLNYHYLLQFRYWH